MTTSRSTPAGRAGYYTTAAALAILFLFPLVWSGWSSVKGQPGSSQASGYGFGNYRYLVSYGEGLWTYLANTAAVTVMILMVPYATILIPLYVLLDRLGLRNSLVGLSLVFVMFQLPFALFMMRNSFEAVPRELEEAALVDGYVRGFMSGAIRG
jgi:multiple sugar transport system permease protein